MNVAAWPDGVEVTGDGTGIVAHAGLGLVRKIASNWPWAEATARARQRICPLPDTT